VTRQKVVIVTSLVYLSHSYRPRDAAVNDYFARLIESEGLMPSLDPPSTDVNSAKLERHLGQSDAMVAILTERENGVSPHILYEIALGVRSQKPLLVFVEDTLPSTILPAGILQRRFPHRSFPRNTREYRQSLTMLRDYIGEPPPHYQSLLVPRTCLLLGGSTLPDPTVDKIQTYIEKERRYNVLTSARIIDELAQHPIAHDALREIDLVIAFSGPNLDHRDSYLLGISHGICKPVIIFATEPGFPASTKVPSEYWPRIFDQGTDLNVLCEMIVKELELYEEDFLDLEDDSSTERYMQFLINLDGRGRYGARTRNQSVEVVMGDRYDVQGQVAAVGPNAHVHDVTFNQLWEQSSEQIDLQTLAAELGNLRAALRSEAKTPDDDQIVADIGQAELAAKNGNGPDALRHLRNAGKWALGVATSIGAAVAAAAIKSAAGL
jgi:hypothetical protein